MPQRSNMLLPNGLLDPDMPTQELRLHMGELTAQEVRTARAAIRWANSRAQQIQQATAATSSIKEETMYPFAVMIPANPSAAQKALHKKLGALEAALTQSWSQSTSSYGEQWSAENPASGQCAVTAALVQEQLGGDIVRVMFTDRGKTDSHYFNVLPNGERVDFTYRQFSPEVTFEPSLTTDTQALVAATHAYIAGKGFHSEAALVHDYLLSNPNTQARYAELKTAVDEHLRQQKTSRNVA